ncbi:ricin-type beta-trefoil lectin domain protein, partial [Streptomyces mirabilis]|uniref:RICIN domain-containing protein n=1 Tax=Streptomyces mirabilis TaxID=68239 RepID=UPI00362947F1
RCLDDPQANTANGTQLQIYDCNGLSTQVWHLTGSNQGPTGAITGPGTTTKCVDVDTNTPTNGNKVQLWDCGSGVQGQQWTRMSDGTVRSFGKCLDIVANGTANFAKVELWDCDNAGGQQWVPQPNGSLLNPQSGRCLDDPQANTANGTQLQIYDCNGLSTQVWHLP